MTKHFSVANFGHLLGVRLSRHLRRFNHKHLFELIFYIVMSYLINQACMAHIA